jgi:hypothetical protein
MRSEVRIIFFVILYTIPEVHIIVVIWYTMPEVRIIFVIWYTSTNIQSCSRPPAWRVNYLQSRLEQCTRTWVPCTRAVIGGGPYTSVPGQLRRPRQPESSLLALVPFG